MENFEGLKTSEEWYQFLDPDYVVYDPDGWDRTNWNYSWYQELISRDEYEKRVMRSTIMNRTRYPKITTAKYSEFCDEYYRTKPQYQRFGQAFFNKFLRGPGVVEVGNLFYLEDTEKAQKIIWENYIQTESEGSNE